MEVADAFWDNFHDGIIKKKEAKWRYERYRFQAQPSSPAAKAAMALKLRNAHASSSSGKVNKGEVTSQRIPAFIRNVDVSFAFKGIKINPKCWSSMSPKHFTASLIRSLCCSVFMSRVLDAFLYNQILKFVLRKFELPQKGHMSDPSRCHVLWRLSQESHRTNQL